MKNSPKANRLAALVLLSLTATFGTACDDNTRQGGFGQDYSSTGSSGGTGGSSNATGTGGSGNANTGGTGNTSSSGSSGTGSSSSGGNPICTPPAATCQNSVAPCDVDLNTDVTNCGVCGLTCSSGQVCQTGHCATGVPINVCTPTAIAEVCDGVDNDCNGLVDDGFNLSTNAVNCGSCGNTCSAGQSCVNAHCTLNVPANNCVASAEVCDGVDNDCDGVVDQTVNLLIDEANCGLCGRTCSAGQSCINAHCTWDIPQDQCVPQASEACNNIDDDCDTVIDEGINLLSDAANCGSCGKVCPVGAVCQSGSCFFTSPVDVCVISGASELCNNKDDNCDGYVDEGYSLLLDNANCGMCGRACAAGQVCSNGNCQWVVPPNLCTSTAELCDGLDNDCDSAIDDGYNLLNDAANCGSCGRVCAANQVCQNGACQLIIPVDNCTPSAELCDSIDNNCNSAVDEGFNLLIDSVNCGICGRACAAGQVCQNGSCQWIIPPLNCTSTTELCNGIDDDCDSSIDDGYNLLADESNCGACGNVCGAGQVCQNGACQLIVPVDNCTPSAELCDSIDNNCNSSIDELFNLQTDLANCGICGRACAAGQTCLSGQCAWITPPLNCNSVAETCNNIDDDCDGFIDNGFVLNSDEVNCGACGNACAAGQTCLSGKCTNSIPANVCVVVAETCNGIDDDCDLVVDNGFNLLTDEANCGECGNVCPATQTCQSGKCTNKQPANVCVPVSETCNNVDDNCNTLVDEGIDLLSDAANCGTCGRICLAGLYCEAGACAWITPPVNCTVTAEVCDYADNDCDGIIDDGFNLLVDKNNCGMCGLVCAAGQYCSAGACAWIIPQNSCVPTPEICNNKDDNCNSAIDEGFTLLSDANNCGTCGHVCPAGSVCQNALCELITPIALCAPASEACNQIDDDCDDAIDEDFNLNTDPANCGFCGHACGAGQTCVASSCAWITPVNSCVAAGETCNGIDDDCDGGIDEDFVLSTDNANCGTCGNSCGVTANCVNGHCKLKLPASSCTAVAETCNGIDDDCDGGIDEDFSLTSDKNNCGMCGKVCAANQVCQSGHCQWIVPVNSCVAAVETCNNSDDDCDNAIDDGFVLLNDKNNCGTCGHVCPAGSVCQNATCVLVTPVNLCSPVAELCDQIDNDCDDAIDENFNLATDPANCGFCGHDCGVGQTCVASSCAWITPVDICTSAAETCNGIDDDCDGAIDEDFVLSTDNVNCGSCGTACGATATCVNGHCKLKTPASSCTAVAETCNGIDDDCDSGIDEDFSLTSDKNNCGMCGKICAANQVCQSGHCQWTSPVNACVAAVETCNNSDDDCDNAIDDGFVLLSDNANCGTCGHLCQAGTFCQNGKCTYITPISNCTIGVETCNQADDDCDDVIDEDFDLLTDPTNCGYCGHTCGVDQTCMNGACAWITPQDTCVIAAETCNGIDDDCDGAIDEDFVFSNDNTNCGSCGNNCGATATCVNGHCKLKAPINSCVSVVETCNGSDDDCDFLIDEDFVLASDKNNCGTCGKACGANQVCQNGHCQWTAPQNACVSVAETCNQTDDDCDSAIDDGFVLTSDSANCGVCGKSCGAGQVCQNGHCKIVVPVNNCVATAEVCDNIDNDCNGFVDETFNLNTSVTNCGICGKACAANQFCLTGHCQWVTPINTCVPAVETCNSIDDDCDGSIDENFNLNTNKLHCGACNLACAGLATCVNGTCQ